MPKTKEELIAEATKLDIEVKDDMTEEDLQRAIEETAKSKEDPTKLEKEDLIKKIEFLQKDLKKAIDSRDTAKTDRRNIEKKLKDLEDQLKDMPNKDTFKEIKEKYDSMLEAERERQEKEEEENLKKLNEVDRVKATFDKQLKEFKENTSKEIEKAFGIAKEKDKVIEEKDKKLSNLSKRALKSEISAVAASNNALNPNHVVRMVINDFEWNDSLEEFEYIVRDNRGKETSVLTVAEYVKQFLNDDENAYLVKADVTSDGMDTKMTTTTKTTTSTSPKLKGKYDPKNEKIIKEAEERSLKPEEWAELKMKEDKRMGRYKED